MHSCELSGKLYCLQERPNNSALDHMQSLFVGTIMRTRGAVTVSKTRACEPGSTFIALAGLMGCEVPEKQTNRNAGELIVLSQLFVRRSSKKKIL